METMQDGVVSLNFSPVKVHFVSVALLAHRKTYRSIRARVFAPIICYEIYCYRIAPLICDVCFMVYFKTPLEAIS